MGPSPLSWHMACKLKLRCIIDGTASSFNIATEPGDKVSDLKQKIWDMNKNTMGQIDFRTLILYRYSTDLKSPTIDGENTGRGINDRDLQDQQATPRRTFFENSSLVQLPSYTGASSGSNPPSPPIAPTTAPHMLSMDEYIGIGQVERFSGYENLADGSQLIPSYAEHQQDTAIDPDMLHLMNTFVSYEGLSAVAEQDEENQSNNNARSSSSSQGHAQLLSPVARSAHRSRSASAHSRMRLSQSNDMISISGSSSSSSSSSFGGGGINMNAGRAPHQCRNYSFSDQTPDDRFPNLGMLIPPPDYATMPPEYRA
ncbi:hypothetical protein BGZ76_003933 [Entomortierella beljakovae]|nr:hypothetical protein BGZ76_003933 [Entomortierella beljakovae]